MTPAVTYGLISGRIYYPGAEGTRYVLYDDGTFSLWFPSWELRGRYKYENQHVTFDFDWNAQHEGAIGVFDGNRMTVTYNSYMSMADFADAVYELK